jgi:hypothetical protein
MTHTTMTNQEVRAAYRDAGLRAPRRTVYEMNYERLEKLGLYNLKNIEDHVRLEKGAMMPLCFELINKNENIVYFSLCFYGEQNGDLMRDPDLVVRVNHSLQFAEVTTYRNDYMGAYQEVYPEPGKYIPRFKKSLNSYLTTFLKDLHREGYKILPEHINAGPVVL